MEYVVPSTSPDVIVNGDVRDAIVTNGLSFNEYWYDVMPLLVEGVNATESCLNPPVMTTLVGGEGMAMAVTGPK
jgi:hypothetical protein